MTVPESALHPGTGRGPRIVNVARGTDAGAAMSSVNVTPDLPSPDRAFNKPAAI